MPDAAAPEKESAPAFNPKYREAFTGLLYLGQLEKTFEYAGHKFHIRTLRQNEQLQVPLMIQQYQGTLSQGKAVAVAIVAQCILSLDGRPLYQPIAQGQTSSENALARMDVVGEWFPFVIDEVYSQYLTLEAQVREVVNEMGNLSGSVGWMTGSTEPSASQTDEGSSPAPA